MAKLPYKCNGKKITVFGGHETWVKQVKPLLPGARFVPRNRTPDELLVRHSDEIWVQSNALAHKDYNKLMRIARAHHIDVQYFNCASAQKCAMQLATYDRQGEG